MIQRIQTIWLLLVAISTSSQFCVSHCSTSCIVENGLVVVSSIAAIFLYKKRKLQIKLCYGILVLLSISIFLVSLKWMLFFSIFPDILAICSIRKDEKLVRSLNRLRD